MKIAVFSDIHANLPALEAVLEDIKRQAVDLTFCGGDLVGYAPYPNEVIERIRSEEIPTVMGNYDDGVGYQRLLCGCDYRSKEEQRMGEESIRWTKENTTAAAKEFLRGLPHRVELDLGGLRGLLVHGSPRRLNEYLRTELPGEYLMEILDEAGYDVLICGHTHVPYHRKLSGEKHVINVGSVGKPKHGNPNAVYAIVEAGETVAVRFMEVPYDYESVARAIEGSGLPDHFALLLREGRG